MKIPLNAVLSAMVSVIMLGVTLVHWNNEDQDIAQKRQTAFKLAADQISADLQQRLLSYELVLRGVKGFVQGSAAVSAAEYREYMGALKLAETQPGLQGVAIARHVVRADKALSAPIVLIEPMAGRNLRTLGFDIASNPIALPELHTAMDTGTMAMTRSLKLVQDAGADRPACVMYLPLYASGAQVFTVAQRRAAITGWISGPFRIGDLIDSLNQQLDKDISLSIYEDVGTTPGTLIYGSATESVAGMPGTAHDSAHGAALRSSRILQIGGQRWTLVMQAQPAFNARFADNGHSFTVLGGVLLSLMLGALVWMLGTGRERALALAKDMTQELRDVQLELEGTLNAMPDLMFELDLEGKYHNYRTSRHNLLAAPPDELVGKRISDVLPPPAAQVCAEALQQAHESGYSSGRQIEIPLPPGNRWFELSVARKPVKPGDEPRFIMISRDITDRKLAELALEKSNAQLTLLETCVSQINDIVVITDAEPLGSPGPRIVFVNDAFVRRTGYSREEVMGNTPRILQGPKSDSATLRRIREGLERWEPVREELINYTKSGEEFWLELVIVPVADATGWFTHWVAVERDITERKLTQDALVRSEQSLNEAQMLAQIGSYERDLNTGVWISSPALDQIFGIDAGYDKTPEGWDRLLAPGYLAPMMAQYQDAIAGNGKFAYAYEIIRPGDGQRRWVSALGSFGYGADAKPVRLKGTIQDITDIKRTQHQMQASVREKEALLREVHHRVKNNLQVITSMLRMESARSDADATKSVLRDMQVRIRSMALLHESIYRSGTFAAIDLGVYLRQVATQSLRTLQVTPGQVELQLNLGVVEVSLDQAMPCGLIASELISNCLKHAFPGGRVGRISMELQPSSLPGQWCLRVEDDGVGLPADFEARSQNSLGLQLVSGLATQIGGELQTGPGALFAINFTVVAPGAADVPA